MKFIKLEIQNLASLDRQGGETINFEEGALGDSTIFSIVGPTGSGKSTILDAICLALYNRAPRYPRKKGDRNQNIEIFGELEADEKSRLAPTDSRNILTRGKKEGYSKLTFLANNGTIYRAEWHIRIRVKNFEQPVLSLYKISTNNGVLSEEIAEWDELPQIIGLDYEQFLRTVLIAQGSFANFLTAKENERYELLEKLIGCEEMYTNIATKIKQQKDEAVKAYDLIAANFSAQEKDLIPEEELEGVKARIAELEEKEKQVKEELTKVTEALAWYTTNQTHEENIIKYEKAFNEAKGNLEAFEQQARHLSLHDETLPAVSLYKEIKTAEGSIATLETILKTLSENISKKETEIKTEEEVNLKQLKQIAQKASDELEEQKPRINKAREIKAELEALNTSLREKSKAKNDAEAAKDKADTDVKNNEEKITKAESGLNKAKDDLAALKEAIIEGENRVKQEAEGAASLYKKENDKLEGCDATKLQDAKTLAEKNLTDINATIRIQGDLCAKRNSQKQNLEQQKQLNERNHDIAELLKEFNIEELNDEIEKMVAVYTLMTSENWSQHRSDLKDGEPCPLCGATEHPYQNDEKVASIINDTKDLIDKKRASLNKARTEKEQLTKEQSKNTGLLDGIKHTLETLGSEIALLEAEWINIHSSHSDWTEDVEALKTLLPELEEMVKVANSELKEYYTLVNLVEKLRKSKESAEQAQQNYNKSAQEKIQVAEKKVTDANTLLETEKGKTENLKNQQVEKVRTFTESKEALARALQDVEAKEKALKQEIDDKNPDAFEKALNDAKAKADEAVQSKAEAISKLRERLNEDKGKETATKEQKEQEKKKESTKKDELSAWLSGYNKDKAESPLTEETIALLYSSTDNWENMRATQKCITDAYTSANTTLQNEIKARDEHQEKKPEQEKEKLLERKAELEETSNQELIDAKARMQRHNTAKEQMGEMFSQKQEAEATKREWEEIADAIGGDGKTLRKIAQCYTLRFLIEHANVEIRKFNSRYELQQVKNSLGIRVIDHDRADDIRDTTSLSGGETFIVSLGLALGLSALSSRNISFENLFIDEGFGTLDPDTLATVIDSLAMLQSSQGKKVGVISHTDTMSERITTQIRIIKNGNSGSSHIEIYP